MILGDLIDTTRVYVLGAEVEWDEKLLLRRGTVPYTWAGVAQW